MIFWPSSVCFLSDGSRLHRRPAAFRRRTCGRVRAVGGLAILEGGDRRFWSPSGGVSGVRGCGNRSAKRLRFWFYGSGRGRCRAFCGGFLRRSSETGSRLRELGGGLSDGSGADGLAMRMRCVGLRRWRRRRVRLLGFRCVLAVLPCGCGRADDFASSSGLGRACERRFARCSFASSFSLALYVL